MPPKINQEECDGCGVCADICVMDVFFVPHEGETPVVRYPEECWHCNSCVLDCSQSAIELRMPLPLMMLHVEADDGDGEHYFKYPRRSATTGKAS